MYNKSFEKAISSTEAAIIRGKMGVNNGNKFIQDTYNAINGKNYCGYDKKKA